MNIDYRQRYFSDIIKYIYRFFNNGELLMQINIPYGTKGIFFELPDEDIWQILFPYLEKPVENFKHHFLNTLEQSVSHLTISQIISSRGNPHKLKLAIICDDITNPCSQKQTLDVIIPYLQSHGILLSNTRIVLATGHGRPQERDELFKRFGNWMAPIIVENHSPSTEMIKIGKSFTGQDLYVNKSIYNADLKISISSVSPDPLSGFTGGSQLIIPGIAGIETIADYFQLYSKTPQIRTGQYLNVLRGMADQATDCLNIDFSIHLVLNVLDGICDVFCGNHRDAFLRAAEYSYRISKVRIRPGADLVIAGCYPSDSDLWQVFRTFINLAPVAREGGIVLLLAPCSEGTESCSSLPKYIDSGMESITNTLNNGNLADKPSAAMAGKITEELAKRDLCIVSEGISQESICQSQKIKVFGNINEALEFCRKKLGEKIKASLVPYGSRIIPYQETDDELSNPMRTRWL
jgi:lactate racemase